MILIAHRGNFDGPNPGKENHPDYLTNAISHGYHAEVDAWYIDRKWLLGHDEPQYEIDISFLLHDFFWVHCKNYEAMRELILLRDVVNFFYHTDEDYVLTSKGYIWAYPDKPGDRHTICVMPEWKDTPVAGYVGICSDFIQKYQENISE